VITVAAVIPAYNEEQRLPATIQAVKTVAAINHIRVINDGSTDNTLAVARETGVEVIDLARNLGKGEALNRGVRDLAADVYVFLDADLGATASEAHKIIAPVVEGEADLCVGRFPPAQKKGGFGMVKKLAGWGIAQAGKIVAEPLSGQRAMTAQVLRDMLPFHSGYGIEVGMTIRALRHGYRLTEVMVNMSHAETGRDMKGFIHRGRQFADVFKVIVAEGIRRQD
jgi:glycosyltransferase involved in cell wall biosynthesis